MAKHKRKRATADFNADPDPVAFQLGSSDYQIRPFYRNPFPPGQDATQWHAGYDAQRVLTIPQQKPRSFKLHGKWVQRQDPTS